MLNHNKYQSFEKAERIWKILWEKLPVKYPFLSWEWQKIWWKVFPEGKLLIYEILENDNILGICPLRIEDKTAKWSSGEEVSDYLDIISMEENKYEIWNQIVKDLIKNGIKQIELRNIPERSITLSALEEISKEDKLEIIKQKEDVVPYIELPKSFDDYLKSLTRKNRHELRRKVRRFEKETNGKWRIEKSKKEKLDNNCKAFFNLFRMDGINKSNFLTKKMEEFFCKEVRNMEELGLLDLTSLYINGGIVAQAISFVSDKTFYLYNMAFDPEFDHLSPGMFLNKCLIEESIEKKRKIYDFMQGSEHYKYQLGAKDKYVYKIIMNIR